MSNSPRARPCCVSWANTPPLSSPPDALRAACAQAEAAHARVRSHPGSAAAMTSFRLAEEILADTRARLLAEAGSAAAKRTATGPDAGPGADSSTATPTDSPADAASARGDGKEAGATETETETETDAEAARAALQQQLAASDATLAFARRQFNAAVQDYNLAVHQFPTWLVANLFHFRAAGAM
jgi:LemA family